ncbi:multiple organellar RNA editing factor 8, chloroplastic/mitochondrial-like [Alnus glutinosa]|uniref:multiple organellar RNA editing factor 8, chloroplastic/mitochondrial-like n=1 Tax=Alnus glutinosa TaxID=3517 RepID=UPI002D7862C4|nr:multiple organellar RNA editing factor 8, chloroplastic/mitochondrial-like [Alnus glutinosa]
MAIHSLSRSLPKTLTLASFLSRSFATSNAAASSRSAISSLSLLRPLAAAGVVLRRVSSAAPLRGFATRATSSSLNDPNPNWSNRPPKETIMLDGCDFEHWLVVVEKPEGDPTRDEIIDSYIKTLAKVIGSEEEARMKIYSVSTRCYYAFGALVSEEISYKLKEVPGVRWVLPDSYLDVRNKDYGGEPFINGCAVPYDPKYHEEWIRNNARANERNRRNDRPRNFDRSRNFERRRENMQNRDFQNRPPMPNQPMQNPGPNMVGPPDLQNRSPMPNQTMQNPGPNMAGVPPNNNMGRMPPNNFSGMPPNNSMGGNNYNGIPPNNMQPNNYMPPNYNGMPTNMGGMPPAPNMGGMPPPPPNMGGMPPPPPNMGGGLPNNMGGGPPNNMGGGPLNPAWSNNMPNREYQRPNTEYQSSYPPNRNMGPGGNPYSG